MILVELGIVTIATDTKVDWYAIAATVAGSSLGALVTGYIGYQTAVKAGRNAVNQAKLEECLMLVNGMEVIAREEVRGLATYLRSHGMTAAQMFLKDIDPDDAVRVAERIHVLIRLHFQELDPQADKLLIAARDTRSLYTAVSQRHGVGSADILEGWHDAAKAFSDEMLLRCRALSSALISRASTQ